MKILKFEEYQSLVNDIANKQYSNDVDDKENEEQHPKYIDLSNIRNKNEIISYTDKIQAVIKVGNFILSIYNQDNKSLVQHINSIMIYDSKGRKFIHPNKDNRFLTQSWISYFKKGSIGQNIPKILFADIVRYLQALTNMSAFI